LSSAAFCGLFTIGRKILIFVDAKAEHRTVECRAKFYFALNRDGIFRQI